MTYHLVMATLSRQIHEAEAIERGPVGERLAPRPYLRRGHWHHYWTGPRKPPPEAPPAETAAAPRSGG